VANNAVKSVRICPGDFHGTWSVITLFWELNIPVAAAGLLLWARWPRGYRSTATEVAGECVQCHVVSIRR